MTFLFHVKTRSQNQFVPQSELGKSADIIGGQFEFGENCFYQEEGPTSKQYVNNFSTDITELQTLNSKFVDQTGYKTAAELGYNEKAF